jgi:hypothetical protein
MALVPPDVEEQIRALVSLIRTNTNPKKAVEDALRAVINSSEIFLPGLNSHQAPEPEPVSLAAYASFPKLLHMMSVLATNPATAKKNTVSLLHEYSTRTSLVVRDFRLH